MKKILSIIALGLLLGGNAYAGNDNDDTRFKKNSLKVSLGSTAKFACKQLHLCQGNGAVETIYYPKFKTEIWIFTWTYDKYFL